ncbi:hypothetical protein BJY52DRAFT_601857 [Lactarius psammicola]|nr:hypothetical protein BJY52DRAFT_601857 [Lactarius psammicola]
MIYPPIRRAAQFGRIPALPRRHSRKLIHSHAPRRLHSLGDETYAVPDTTSWIVPEGMDLFFLSELIYAHGYPCRALGAVQCRKRTIGERLQPTIDDSAEERDKAAKRVALPFESIITYLPLSAHGEQPKDVKLLTQQRHWRASRPRPGTSIDSAGYRAGSDTTVSPMSSLFLALIFYPQVQKRAQVELDSVVSGDRLPTYDDKSRLPYIEAMRKETIR